MTTKKNRKLGALCGFQALLDPAKVKGGNGDDETTGSGGSGTGGGQGSGPPPPIA